MEAWIGGKGVEGECGENESHEMWSWSPESSYSRKYPCGVCGKSVDANPIQCTLCMKWIHKRCSGISRKLRAKDAEAFKCKTCVKGAQGSIKTEARCVELDDGSKFELVDKFCYLGDMLCAGRGPEDASRTRVRSAWGKFNELAPVLTKRGVSLKLKGKIYEACVQSVGLW